MSSRNVYLSAAERRAGAGAVSGDARGRPARRRGRSDRVLSRNRAKKRRREAGSAIDYLEARQAETLARVARRREGPIRLLAAARLGATRLIDNLAV